MEGGVVPVGDQPQADPAVKLWGMKHTTEVSYLLARSLPFNAPVAVGYCQ